MLIIIIPFKITKGSIKKKTAYDKLHINKYFKYWFNVLYSKMIKKTIFFEYIKLVKQKLIFNRLKSMD